MLPSTIHLRNFVSAPSHLHPIDAPFVEGTSSRPVLETASLMAKASALKADSELQKGRVSEVSKQVKRRAYSSDKLPVTIDRTVSYTKQASCSNGHAM